MPKPLKKRSTADSLFAFTHKPRGAKGSVTAATQRKSCQVHPHCTNKPRLAHLAPALPVRPVAPWVTLSPLARRNCCQSATL